MGNKISLSGKIRAIVSDSIWSILALMLINCIAQFLVYPVWSRMFDTEHYGNIIYVMSLVNTFSVSIGVATNYARMSESVHRETENGDYNWLLLICGVVAGAVSFILIVLSDLGMSSSEALLAAVLAVLTMWRYYADVEYRLSLNYKGYFVYYLFISIGYLIGIGLFRVTKLWPLALIPGELLGLLRIFAKGELFRKAPLKCGEFFWDNCQNVMLLVFTNMISNAIFNGDRILLQIALNGTAVTMYYLASLVGKTMSLVTTPLNSVIMGYLARYKGEINRKMITLFAMATLVAIALGTAVGVIGSHILIRILYPDNYVQAKEYFLIANLAQVIYFMTNIVTTLLLRIAKPNRQLYVNGIYAGAFVLLCIPAVYFWGFSGFCVALVMANVARYVAALGICYLSIGRRK